MQKINFRNLTVKMTAAFFLLAALLLTAYFYHVSNEEKQSAKIHMPTVSSSFDLGNINMKLGSVIFKNEFKLDATWGIGSGAYHAKNDGANEVYVVTDRGVNIKCKDSEKIIGEKICDDGKIFPFPGFTPSIMKLGIDESNHKVTLLELITLKDKNGKAISGISNPLSNFSEMA